MSKYSFFTMSAIILILMGLIALMVVLKVLYRPSELDVSAVNKPVSGACSTCAGSSAKCEQECMLEASTRPIEYFDDEELDRYRGKASSRYTEDEVAEFAEVLHTMRQTEVKDWCRSLTLRGISLPDQLKDEAFMLMEG